jgi:CubicO group peptidase (beta-lactamase class C family)
VSNEARPFSGRETSIVIWLALVVSLLGLAVGDQERIGSVRDMYDGTLPVGVEVNTFRHIDRVFPSAVVKHGGRAFPLPQAKTQLRDVTFTSMGQRLHLADYIALNRVAGLLVLQDGKIALERYEFGNTPQTRWVSFSMVKSITSTLAAAAVQDGLMGGLDEAVTKYLPELRGSGYEGVSIRNVMQMASGVRWNETYTDRSSDRRKMLELQTEQRAGALIRFMATLPRAAQPGTRWNYSTGETYVLGALVRAAVKRPLSQYLSEKIWSVFAMEKDATWWTESNAGVEFGGSGFAATLRDYGRFGQFVLQDGVAGRKPVVPPGWFPNAGLPKRVGGQLVRYGYMWWSEPEGAFRAFGIFGQSIYVNPGRKVVIVVWSAQEKPTGSAIVSDTDFFTGVLQALQ